MRGVLLALLAMTSWYRVSDFGGPDARYCGLVPPEGPLVAVEVGLIQSGVVECGEVLTLYYHDHGITQQVTVWDVGPLGDYYIEDHPDLPLMLDLDYESGAWPVALDGLLSARVSIYSYSALLEEAERRIPR